MCVRETPHASAAAEADQPQPYSHSTVIPFLQFFIIFANLTICNRSASCSRAGYVFTYTEKTITMQEKNTAYPIFSSRLRAAMQHKQLTQKKLEELSKIRQTSISDYLNGKAVPSADALSRLSDALGVTMDYLWGKGDEEKNQPSEQTESSKTEAILRAKLDMATSALETLIKKLKQ